MTKENSTLICGIIVAVTQVHLSVVFLKELGKISLAPSGFLSERNKRVFWC